MAEDEPAQDFKDILAAYDIPDVPSSTASQGSKMQRVDSEKGAYCEKITSDNNESNKSKPEILPKTPDLQSSSDYASHPHQLPVLRNYMDRESDFKLLTNGLGSELSTPPKQWKAMEKELNMYQITANALPAYVPSIPPHARANMNVPTNGIRCMECDDTFLFEHNLMEHLQRRSVLINFNCDSCKKPLIYYNKCTLRNHVRLHRERNEPADIDKASVMVLPPELMNGYPSFASLPFMQNALMQQFHLQQPLPLMISSQMQQMSNMKNSKPISPNINSSNGSLPSSHQPLLLSPSLKCKFLCSECRQSYENSLLLEEHLGCSQNLPLGSSQCSKCNMTCASKCSLSAHERIHSNAKPFTCPECGLTLNNKEVFNYHITIKCMHYNRVIGYKCSICLTLYTEPVDMRSHIIAEHTEAYYKCQACPMAFKAGHSLDSHKKTAHLTMDVESKTIYKCPLCDTVFEGDKNLNEHLDAHIKEQIQNIKFVYRCSTCEDTTKCEELFMKKSALRDHIAKTHPENLEIPCSSCDAMFNTPEDLEKHFSDKHPISNVDEQSPTQVTESSLNGNAKEISFPVSPFINHDTQSASYVCSNCGDNFHNLNGYLTHKETCGSLRLHCKICQLTFEKKEDMVKDGRKHLSEGVLVCLLCSNRTQFESKKALFRHVEVHVPSENEFECDLCSTKYSDSKEFLKHLRSEHGFNPVKCDMCDAEFYGTARMQRHKSLVHDKSVQTFSCPLCNDNSFTTQGFLDKHLIISHDKSLEDIAKLRNHLPVQFRPPSAASIIPAKGKTEVSFDNESGSGSPVPAINVDFHPDNTINMEIEDDSVAPPPKRLTLNTCQNRMNALLTCYKCQFVSDDRAVFSEHITAHKTDPLAYQCCECGTCFVAVPSLRKHMFLEHGIRDFHTYLSEVGQTVIANVEDLTSKACCNFNCDVCCQSFVDESSLKNHMRNHGMAFVKSHSMSVGSSENDAE